LVALLIVTGGAAGLGVSMQPNTSPPQANTTLGRFVAATEAAGTARFTETMTFGSSTPSPVSRTTGVVSFTGEEWQGTTESSTVDTTSTDGGPAKTSVQWTHTQVMMIGDRAYTSSARRHHWTESSLPLTATQLLGFGLWLPEGARLKATFVGHATLRGVTTSLYRLTSTSGGSHSCPTSPRIRTVVEMWVDDQSRLVQTRTTMRYLSLGLSVPGLPNNLPSLPISVFTLQLSDFGTPVAITPPPVKPQPHSSPSAGDRPQSISGHAITIKECDDHALTIRTGSETLRQTAATRG
jgi:hypothetical protein